MPFELILTSQAEYAYVNNRYTTNEALQGVTYSSIFSVILLNAVV